MTVRLRAVYEHAGAVRNAVATTLGAGGLFVASEDPPPSGTTLRICFRVPGGTRDHALDARVVWTHRPGDPGAQSHGMGLAFTNAADCVALAAELEGLANASAEGARDEPR